MIIVKAPLRISFVGGGSDFPDFYKKYTGKVISTTINKYVYVMINTSPLLKGITARYSQIEQVDKLDDLKNDRIREVMKYFKVKEPIEVSVISDLPVGLGLGGSSAFTVALIKGFSILKGEQLTPMQIAELACGIEIDKLKEPIGVQDQVASAMGGFNLMEFKKGNWIYFSPTAEFKDFQEYLLLFFTDQTREAKTILKEQKENIPDKITALKAIVDLVDLFKESLIKRDFREAGKIIEDSWLLKKTLASKITDPLIDYLYKKGIEAGAWGGKLLGAGGGGCLLFVAPKSSHEIIRQALNLTEIPFEFSDKGVEIIYD